MKIENASDLIFWTYYMLDWTKVKQGRSGTSCLRCGRKMNAVEAVTDKKGFAYDGLVCHNCKSLLWFKKD